MLREKTLWIILLLAFFSISSCTSYRNSAAKRAEKAKRFKGDIVIGVVWPETYFKDLFVKGVDLAVEEINNKGGILGRRIKTIFYDEKPSIRKSLKIAKRFAGDYDVVAVIGHPISDIAIPVSVTYEYSGIVFISPGATAPGLTVHGFQYVFRNIPSDSDVARQIVEFVHQKGFKKAVIIDDNTLYGKGLADSFHEYAYKTGIEITLRKTYYQWQNDFKPLATSIKAVPYDILFLSGSVPDAARVIKQCREMGITAPFIGGDGLDSPDLWKIAAETSEGTIVPSVFNPNLTDPIIQDYNKRFYERFKIPSDSWAALGYDAIKLLAYAFEKSRSTVPIVASSTIRYTENWKGVTGTDSFSISGDVTGKKIFFKAMHNGEFEYLKEDEEEKNDSMEEE